MRITIEEFRVRTQLFSDLINAHLEKGNIYEAYALTLALIQELEDTSASLRSSILEPLARGVQQRALCIVNQEVIKTRQKTTKTPRRKR